MKQLIKDIIAFFPRIFRESWWSAKWEWEYRREKNNRAKRKRKWHDFDRYRKAVWFARSQRV